MVVQTIVKLLNSLFCLHKHDSNLITHLIENIQTCKW